MRRSGLSSEDRTAANLKRKKSEADQSQKTTTSKSNFFARSLEKVFGRLKKDHSHGIKEQDASDGSKETQANYPKIPPEVEQVMNNFLQKLASSGLETLKSEWLDVACHLPLNVSSMLYDYNSAKNFPGGCPCLDYTRVGLTFNVPPDTDYIHANWIRTKQCSLGLRLILTQAPQDVTVNDFYRCIWQEKVKSVVMLCDKYESNKRVCAQYWPVNVGDIRRFGPLMVQNVADLTPEGENGYTKMHLTISYRSEQALDTFVYIFKKWPDNLVPESTRSLLRAIRAVMDDGYTVLVHGAAGVGRPSVFAAVLIAQRMFGEAKPVSVLEIAKSIREQRMGGIATELQYIFIYRAICEYIRAKGVNLVLCKQLINHLDQYKKDYIAAGNKPVDVAPGPFPISNSRENIHAPPVPIGGKQHHQAENEAKKALDTQSNALSMGRQNQKRSKEFPPQSQHQSRPQPPGMFGVSSPPPVQQQRQPNATPPPVNFGQQNVAAQPPPLQPTSAASKPGDQYEPLNMLQQCPPPPPKKI